MDNKIEYNKDIISQLIKLEIGDMEEIIDAMNNVMNKKDINEIVDYITKNQPKKLKQSNTNSNSTEEKEKSDIYSSLLPVIGENKNKKYIDDAINNVSNKNDIQQICYFLINKNKPTSTGYTLFLCFCLTLSFVVFDEINTKEHKYTLK